MVSEYFRGLVTVAREGWNRFWFTPEDPATLGLIRFLTGLMLLYTHAVWSIDLAGFFSRDGRLSPEFVANFHQHSWFASTWFDSLGSGRLLWMCHIVSLSIFGLLALGLWTRVVSILAFLTASAYAHRAAGATFGLDQINVMLSMYLMVGDSGGAFSLDQWRRQGTFGSVRAPRVSTNIAIRLMQVHMCIIYFFAALGKLQGISWWEGTAMWLALASYEYQTFDMTFLRRWPWILNALTHITVFWELTYPALVWPRWTRPIVLALAVPLHLGIAVCMGMITFGLIMLVGNMSFVSPRLIKACLGMDVESHLPRTVSCATRPAA